MNLRHLRYVVAVAKEKSISRAAEKLYMAAPNLSRYIKSLEDELGVAIFIRKNDGISLTYEGMRFVAEAEYLLQKAIELENMFKDENQKHTQFSICVPDTSYSFEAFRLFLQQQKKNYYELQYVLADTQHTLQNVVSGLFDFGIIRYAQMYSELFEEYFASHNLQWKILSRFQYQALLRADNPLAKKETLYAKDLWDMIVVARKDHMVANTSPNSSMVNELPAFMERHIFVNDCLTQFETIATLDNAYTLTCPLPQTILDRYGFVQRKYLDFDRMHYDMLFWKKDHEKSHLATLFLECHKKISGQFSE
ncbi:MAG: LysR family transcriptional regulator [Clostridia bacterium]|nr:LysR family transcriptional regulator [Clostridia bacterium]